MRTPGCTAPAPTVNRRKRPHLLDLLMEFAAHAGDATVHVVQLAVEAEEQVRRVRVVELRFVDHALEWLPLGGQDLRNDGHVGDRDIGRGYSKGCFMQRVVRGGDF